MSGFAFRLQPLLDLLEHEERDAYAALLAAVRARVLERERSAELRAERSRVGRTFATPAGLEPEAVCDAFARLDFIAAAIARQDVATAHASDRECAVRGAFAAARREHRRLAALRDRAHAVYARELEYRDSSALDDANAANHNSTILLAPSFHN
jgi:hypothetical protein